MKSDEPTKERLLAEIAERMRVEEQLRAANRTLRTINRCNEALVRATEEIELAQAICRILVEDGGMRMAWVGYREENAASGSADRARWIRRWISRSHRCCARPTRPTAQGPTAVAIRTGEPCSTDDIATDPRFRQLAGRGAQARVWVLARAAAEVRWDGVRRPHPLRRPVTRFRRADAFAFHRTRQRPGLWGDGDPDPSRSRAGGGGIAPHRSVS